MSLPDARKVDAALRWRNGLLLAAVLLPTGCSALFERQARRLDALADHGQQADAEVLRVDGQGTTYYQYVVGPTVHQWSVARAAVPFPVGAHFPVAYLPEDPSFSRPLTGPGRAAEEVVRNRRFAGRFAVGAALFLLLFAGLGHRELERLRSGLDPQDPAVFRRRVRESLAVMFVLVAGVSSWHALDARSRGESVVPVAAALLLSLGLMTGTVFFIARRGPAEAATRRASLLRWMVPAAMAIAVLRLIAALVAR